jgi:hypothetical protein
MLGSISSTHYLCCYLPLLPFFDPLPLHSHLLMIDLLLALCLVQSINNGILPSLDKVSLHLSEFDFDQQGTSLQAGKIILPSDRYER